MGQYYKYSGISIIIIAFLAFSSCDDLLNELDSNKHPLHVQLRIMSPAADTATATQAGIPVIDEVSFNITGNSLYTPTGNVYSLPYSVEPISLKQTDSLTVIAQTSAPANNYKNFDVMFGIPGSESDSAGAFQIKGTLNGNPFTYEIEDSFSIDFELNPPFSHGMGKDSLSVLVISFDSSNWLSEEDITGNKPASDSEVIARIIESATVEVFESGTKTGGGNPKNDITVGLANDPKVNENEENAQFIAELSKISPDTIWLDFQTSENSTKAGIDFADSTGTLILEPGLIMGFITIPIFDDNESEADQKFSLLLTDARGAVINKFKALAMATIVDDDD